MWFFLSSLHSILCLYRLNEANIVQHTTCQESAFKLCATPNTNGIRWKNSFLLKTIISWYCVWCDAVNWFFFCSKHELYYLTYICGCLRQGRTAQQQPPFSTYFINMLTVMVYYPLKGITNRILNLISQMCHCVWFCLRIYLHFYLVD